MRVLALAKQIQAYGLGHNRVAFMKPLNDKIDELVKELEAIAQDQGGCKNCKHRFILPNEEPCKGCRLSYGSNFEAKE